LDLINEGRKEEGKQEKDLVNITYLRNILPKLYSKNDRTGFLNFRNIEDTIKGMEEAGLITKDKKGKQEKPLKLTSVGYDIYLFIHNLDKFHDSYFKFLNSLAKKLLFIDARYLYLMDFTENEMNSSFEIARLKQEITNFKKLLSKHGWSKTEIILYNEIRSNLIELKAVCDRNFLNMVLFRYAMIRKEHHTDHPLIQGFFEYLIKDAIGKKIDFILSNFEQESMGYSRIRNINPVNTDLIRHLDTLQAGINIENHFYPKLYEHVASRETVNEEFEYFISLFDLFYFKVISFSFKDEMEDMMRSYIELLHIHLGNYSTYLDSIKQAIVYIQTQLEKNTKLSTLDKEKLLLAQRTAETFLNVLLKYAKRNNMQIVTFNPL